METIWFIVIGILFSGYAILDGFDLGVGAIYLLVAKGEAERQQVRSSIGPIWDGNEVWLIAAGGTLFFAFPKAYAVGFSAYYLAFFLILWLLILRGLAIELRGQLENTLWHTFWDVVFSFASLALAGLLGVALGNLLRGIPLREAGEVALPFWTNFQPVMQAGLLDWYTLLGGVVAVAAVILQGANYLILKTKGEVMRRSRTIARRSLLILVPLVFIVFGLTPRVQPVLKVHFTAQPLGFIFPLLIIVLLAGQFIFLRRESDRWAFVASSLLILFILATAFFGLYPNLVLASVDPSKSLTIYNAATNEYGLRVGLIWFSIGFLLMLAYVGFMYRSFWGKVTTQPEDQDY